MNRHHQLRRRRNGVVYCTCGGEIEHEQCERCGGDGSVEYDDAPDTWGEDCPSELNHLVECPECDGEGTFPHCTRARSEAMARQGGGG